VLRPLAHAQRSDAITPARHGEVDLPELLRRNHSTLRPPPAWRSTRSSTSLVEDVRPISRASPSTCRKMKYSNRSDTLDHDPTSDHRWSAIQARLLAPHTVLFQ
jgi:hypothetical protein